MVNNTKSYTKRSFRD